GLMIRVPEAADPCVPPRDQPVRLYLTDEARDANEGFAIIGDGGVRQVEERVLGPEKPCGVGTLLLSSASDLDRWYGTERLRLLAAAEPDDDHPVPSSPLRQNGSGNAQFVVRMTEPDQKCLLRQFPLPERVISPRILRHGGRRGKRRCSGAGREGDWCRGSER